MFMEPCALFCVTMLLLVTPFVPFWFYELSCPQLFFHSKKLNKNQWDSNFAVLGLLYWFEAHVQLQLKGCFGNFKFLICIDWVPLVNKLDSSNWDRSVYSVTSSATQIQMLSYFLDDASTCTYLCPMVLTFSHIKNPSFVPRPHLKQTKSWATAWGLCAIQISKKASDLARTCLFQKQPCGYLKTP